MSDPQVFNDPIFHAAEVDVVLLKLARFGEELRAGARNGSSAQCREAALEIYSIGDFLWRVTENEHEEDWSGEWAERGGDE